MRLIISGETPWDVWDGDMVYVFKVGGVGG